MTSCVIGLFIAPCSVAHSKALLHSLYCIGRETRCFMAVWQPHQPPYFLFCLQLNFSRVLSGCCLPLSSQVTLTLLLFPSLQMCSPTTVNMTASAQIQRLPQWTWPHLTKSRGYFSVVTFLLTLATVKTGHFSLNFLFPLILCHGLAPLPHSSPLLLCWI